MNAAAQMVRRRHILELLDALCDIRANFTEEIFSYQLEEQAAKSRRNNVDTQMQILFYELSLLTEGFKCQNYTNSAPNSPPSTTKS
jgi:hypothetical protein